MDKVIIANWKANPTTLEEALGLFDFYLTEISKYQNIRLIICPPFVYLEEIAKKLQTTNYKLQTSLGAQDLFWEKSGPYTGEISVDMLKNFGVTHVLVGHSDRRYKIGETDETVNKKIKAALEADIVPVLLVGERNRTRPSEALEERRRDDGRQVVLEQQLMADLAGLTPEQVSRILITYEPVWAISTQSDAQPDTPNNTLVAMKIIDNFVTINYQLPSKSYLYGGSVNKDNAVDFLRHPEIAGAVIGGASLRKDEFSEILRISAGL